MIDLAPEQLALVRQIVARYLREGEVFAFGSRVNGKARKFSDLDLMIKVEHGLSWRKLADLREAFESSELPVTVDVVDWSNCSAEFRRIVGPDLVRIN